MSVIEEIRAGSKAAIKKVYKENAKDVYNFARSITGNHDTALDATKKTFVILVKNIQNGETPTNIRLAALKIAYDEACAIAMPSTAAIKSPYDKPEDSSSDALSKKEAAFPEADDEEEAPKIQMEPQPEVSEKEIREPEEPETESEEAEDIAEDTDEDIDEETDEDTAEEAAEDNDDDFDDEFEEDEYIIEPVEVETKPVQRRRSNASTPGELVKERQERRTKTGRRHPVLYWILMIINIILILILIWFLLGLLTNIGILPESFDLGHEWFNTHIYPIF